MTKLQRFLDGFGAIYNAIYFRFDLQDNIDRCAFFYEISSGWYEMYDPDDMGVRNPWNLMSRNICTRLSEEDYDAIMKALDEPPKYMIGLANLMKRELPYDR